jgi:S-layer homology domain.
MKKTVAAIVAVVMVFASAAVAYASGYMDVKPGHWAYDAVNTMSDRSVVIGYPDGTFKPGNTVTYGEFIKMALVADTGEDAGNSKTGNWSLNYYNKALELKYFTQYDIDKANLNKQITRAHMALIISSILGDVKIGNYDEIQKGITDITYKTAYEYDITKAYAMGILTGYTDKTFKPSKTLTRAEAATVIYRLVDESKREYPNGKDGSTGVKEKTIDEMITNLRSFVTTNGHIDDDLAEAETYEIDADYSKYGLELHENRGTKWVSIPENVKNDLGRMYLIKDNKAIELMARWDDTAGYDSDITTMDYIGSLTSDNHLVLIANPFKQ